MNINWIKITERAQEGLQIINALPNDVFKTVLFYVHRQMDNTFADEDEDVSSTDNLASFTNDDYQKDNKDLENEISLEELEKLVGIPRNDFLLMIKTFSYLLRRITTFIIKPSILAQDLRDKLQIKDEVKIDAILRLWKQQTDAMLNNLADEKYESNEVQDVAWKLNVEISSQCEQQEKKALAVLQLKTAASEDINMEMNHQELLNLYNQFENIQTEIDNLKVLNKTETN